MAAPKRAVMGLGQSYRCATPIIKEKKAYTHINGAGLICTELRQIWPNNAPVSWPKRKTKVVIFF